MTKYEIIKLEDYLDIPLILSDWVHNHKGYKIYVSPSTFRSSKTFLGFLNEAAEDCLINTDRRICIYSSERVPDNRAYAAKLKRSD